jgi:hypothetical protein
MTEQELKDYAEALILGHATEVEYLTIFEMAEGYLDGDEISDEDADKVDRLIGQAKISVTWGD